MTSPSRPPVPALLLAALLALPAVAGCGTDSGSDAGSASSAAPATRSTTPSPTPSPTAGPTPPPPMTTQPAAEAAGVVDVVPAGMDEDLVRVGRMFLRLARGAAGATLPVEPQVTVLLGGEQATVLTSTQADDRASWEQLCDSSGKGYAERSCPVSALAALADSEGVTFSTEPAQEPCSGPHGLEPGDVGGTKRVTLLARPHGSCLDYAAVELYLNDVSQLVAANLVLGSP